MSRSRFSRVTRTHVAAFLVAGVLVGTSTAAATAQNNVIADLGFFFNCLGLMIVDPNQHVVVCNPVPQNVNPSVGLGGGVAPVPSTSTTYYPTTTTTYYYPTTTTTYYYPTTTTTCCSG